MVRLSLTPLPQTVRASVVGLLAATTMVFTGGAGAAAASSGTPCGPAARACVNLSSQQAWLMHDGNITYGPVPIASGKAGATSDQGTFHVFWKDRHHRSSLFNDAPMPYSVFYNGGEAFHQDSVRTRSNGCIHLSQSAAKTFFNTLQVGDVVQVVR